MLLGTLGASLLGNLLARKGAIATRQGKNTIRSVESIIRPGKGTIRAGQDFSCHLIVLQIFKQKSIIKMNLNLKVFIQEIIYLK